MYNGQIDPVEHVSHFNQRMIVHSKNEALMCKVFPFSLGLVAMRWFDGLWVGSIDSFKELSRAFGSHSITCSRVSRPLDSLLSMIMREGETLKMYSDRYWKMFNEIDEDFDDVAIRTFKVGLPAEHSLRKSLTGKLVNNVGQLMDRIDKYKRIEEDQLLGKGKAKGGQAGSGPQRGASSKLPLGTINVILAAPEKQPHEDALVVTLRIGGYDVRKILVD
ncbi:uncharacterized protein LOC142629142 [Castanea sativa]|uniref:uncharacterized protein LOC142629142 n=1 Tax=Castanea sativa TaxID=21020 RepID=UPI003F64D9A3